MSAITREDVVSRSGDKLAIATSVANAGSDIDQSFANVVPADLVLDEQADELSNMDFVVKPLSTVRRSSKSSKSARNATTSSISSRSSVSSRGSNAVHSSSNDDPTLSEEVSVSTESKERSREKNKVAAAKCRAKKRENTEMIENNHRTLSAENNYLKRHEQQLRATVAQLRTLALDHQHCNCGVHQYNMIQAGHLARGLGGLHRQHFGAESCAMHASSQPVSPQSASTSQVASVRSSDISPIFQDMSHDMTQMEVDLAMDLEQSNPLGLQTPMDQFFYDFNGPSDFINDS